jgi:hypothetical protein
MTVTFLANFPGTNSDIKFGPDGARIILDIPKTHEGAAAQLLMLREVILEVTVKEFSPPRRPGDDDAAGVGAALY